MQVWIGASKYGVTSDPLCTSCEGVSDLLLEFWDLLHISGTVEARNFKFGTQIDHEDTNERT